MSKSERDAYVASWVNPARTAFYICQTQEERDAVLEHVRWVTRRAKARYDAGYAGQVAIDPIDNEVMAPAKLHDMMDNYIDDNNGGLD